MAKKLPLRETSSRNKKEKEKTSSGQASNTREKGWRPNKKAETDWADRVVPYKQQFELWSGRDLHLCFQSQIYQLQSRPLPSVKVEVLLKRKLYS